MAGLLVSCVINGSIIAIFAMTFYESNCAALQVLEIILKSALQVLEITS
jgi:hypothetical protein